jgi:hypothetical protein
MVGLILLRVCRHWCITLKVDVPSSQQSDQHDVSILEEAVSTNDQPEDPDTHPKEPAMIPVAVYHDLVSIGAILLGIVFIWLAVFSILVWLLDYVPVKVTPWPESRSGRIALIMALFATGIICVMMPETIVQPATLTSGAMIDALVLTYIALMSCVFVCVSIFELRHAVRLSRQQRRQQASD